MQRGKTEMSGLGDGQSRFNRFEVAQFAEKNNIGILTENRFDRPFKRDGVGTDFSLIDDTIFMRMNKFDGIFDGDNMLTPFGIDRIDNRCQGR